MATVLAQTGTSLVLINPVTGATETLDLPDGVTIDSTKLPSIATLALGAVVVYSPTRNLLLTQDRTLVLLNPAKPSAAPTAAVGTAGVLTGAYQYAVSFIRKDANDNIITESAMSPLSASVTASADKIELTSIPVSTETDTVTGRRLYRTLSGGTILFHLADIDDNSATTYSDNNADASLSILPENEHRTEEVPGTNASDTYKLRLVVSWKNRIWGLSTDPKQQDAILYTEDGLVYRWGNELSAYPVGQDRHGVVGLAPRRNELGVLKRDGLWQITGDSDASFSIVQIAIQRAGCVAPRSIVTVNDEVFWLGPDGCYQWGVEGVTSITDERTRPWFLSDRYFERSLFPNAFAKFNTLRDQYELHLVEVDETTSAVWVAFQRSKKAWFGIHRTSVTTLNCATNVETDDGIPLVLIAGQDGYLYSLNENTFHDGPSDNKSAIEWSVVTPKYYGDAPDIEHTWLEPSVLTKVETGGMMGMRATLGRAGDSPQTAEMGVDLTLERERLRRLGLGASAQLEFYQNDVDQPVTLYGFELPFFETGRR